jgi:NAD(P)-dependent dehydrogenase (short-subunit alcohol dehydrogenase family)
MSLTLPDGHRAVVVGAAGAIGAAICRAYADAGARVIALDLDGDAAAALSASVPGGPHDAAALDVTDREAVERVAAAAGAVDSVVYAAGLAPTFELLAFDWEAYHRTLAVNLHGALHVAAAFGGQIVAAGRPGALTVLSSTAGKQGEAGAIAYCASKFALQGVVESFAAEVGARGLRVNAICPGNVDTPMLRGVAAAQAELEGRDADAVLDDYAQGAAARRLVTVEEVGAVAVWLASPLASGITGESVNVDAGALTG